MFIIWDGGSINNDVVIRSGSCIGSVQTTIARVVLAQDEGSAATLCGEDTTEAGDFTADGMPCRLWNCFLT